MAKKMGLLHGFRVMEIKTGLDYAQPTAYSEPAEFHI